MEICMWNNCEGTTWWVMVVASRILLISLGLNIYNWKNMVKNLPDIQKKDGVNERCLLANNNVNNFLQGKHEEQPTYWAYKHMRSNENFYS